MDGATGFAQTLADQKWAAAPAWIYKGYQVTVFSNAEEEASKAQLGGGQMKFYPRTALAEAGLNFSAARCGSRIWWWIAN